MSAEHCFLNIDSITTYDHREFYNTKNSKRKCQNAVNMGFLEQTTIAYGNLGLYWFTQKFSLYKLILVCLKLIPNAKI